MVDILFPLADLAHGLADFFRAQLMPQGVMLGFIGAIVSGASSLANGIFGGITASKAERDQLKAIRRARSENRNWYDRRYNEDATQRADAQRMLSRTNEAIAARNRAAAGKRAVMGGTDASLASTQQANANAMGQAVADITVNAQNRKDDIEAQYRERDQQLRDQAEQVKATAKAARLNAVAQAATGAANAGASIMAAKATTGDNATKAAGTGTGADKGAAKTLDSMKQTLKGTPLPDEQYKQMQNEWERAWA